MKKGTFPKIVEPRLNKKTCSTLRKKEPRITWDTFSKLIKIQQVKITVSNGYINFKEVSYIAVVSLTANIGKFSDIFRLVNF